MGNLSLTKVSRAQLFLILSHSQCNISASPTCINSMSAEIDLKRLKQIDEQTHCLVNGYCKSISSADENIPELLILICLAFYHQFECFDADVHGSMICINEDKDTMTHTADENGIGGHSQSVYGINIIDSMTEAIYGWKFKINYQYSSNNICIGIDEYQNKWINLCFSGESATNNYSLCGDGWSIWSGTACQWHQGSYKTGDEVAMIFDLYDKTLSYKINNSKRFVVFENITTSQDIKYKMCVHVFAEDESVTLMTHSISYQ